ncbi:hypothetical protein [Achromobacter xylosoxidans]|uniref:Uncharacterized protein n=1 Tax=Alcaligenes xylosoxydans xylosoxydans TaxID=85698 RepID=A0A109XYC8_ALCXX|nr:hypothetical protein [Achromobacter xylosoxidans]AMG39998.1 hypothetical protein AL504_30820 [Achromobacter xylosoxidans]
MTAQIAHLNTSEILGELERAYENCAFFIERDWQYAVFSRKAADVRRVCPNEGIVLRACLDSTLGDGEALERDYQELLATQHDSIDLFNVSVAFSTLGYFSKAQSIMRDIATASSGDLSGCRERAISIGLFQHIVEQYVLADKMRLELADSEREPTSFEVARILREAGITDHDVAIQLDVAGAVLRRHKRLCPATAVFAVNGPDNLDVALLQVLVNATPDVLFDLNVEVAEEVLAQDLLVHPNLVVSIGQIEESGKK